MAIAGSWATCNTLEEFDDHIRKMKQQLKEVEYHRNLRVSVCRLPVEIIGKIFTHTTGDGHWVRKFPKVMQVCRLWRAIAAKTPSMWTHLDLSRPKMAQEVLRYSGSIPLRVTMRSDACCQQNLSLEVLEQPSRISSLYLSGISPNHLTNLLAKVTQPVPYLRSIVIRPNGVSVTLPTNFLGEDAPRLVSLHTTGCSIPWGSHAFRNLTSIRVSKSTLPINMSLENIAITLQAATKLVEVDISDFIPSQTNASLPRDFTIVLPHLNRLHLSSRAIVITTLLQRMIFPASAMVHLEISELEDALDSLCSSISGLFADAAIDPKHMRSVETLYLAHYDGQGITLKVWNSFDYRTYGRDTGNHFRLQLEDQVHTAIELDVQPICRRLLDSLGMLSYLKELEVDVPSLQQDTTIECFGSCPLLHTITTYGSCANAVVTSLSYNLSDAPQPIPYPAVSTITLYDVNFDTNRMPTFLVIPLQNRSEHGVPVKKVVLKTCKNLYGNEVEMLKGEVGSEVEIDWDGIEIEVINSGAESSLDDFDDSSDA
ncbi:hypothetical protein PM082_003632 [Marasmius tenuissimus]|nr:hypothetical protein PM082_003632 [Marasmius tenuissimus]